MWISALLLTEQPTAREENTGTMSLLKSIINDDPAPILQLMGE
jgi:hypothetical protein